MADSEKMKDEWQEVFYTPIYKDGSYGEIGHIRYKGEPVENCGLISFENCLDITIVGRTVIRCKDCKYWTELPFAQSTKGYCGRLIQGDYNNHDFYFEMDANDFCSRGELK